MTTLYIYTNDGDLKNMYKNRSSYTNHGLDVISPGDVQIPANSNVRLNLGINVGTSTHTEVFLVPQTRMIKETPLQPISIMLIPGDYSAEVSVIVKNRSNQDYTIQKFSSLFQLFSHNFSPFVNVIVVDNLPTH